MVSARIEWSDPLEAEQVYWHWHPHNMNLGAAALLLTHKTITSTDGKVANAPNYALFAVISELFTPIKPQIKGTI